MLNKVIKNSGIVLTLLFCMNQVGKCQAVNTSANRKAIDTNVIQVSPNLLPPSNSGITVTPNISSSTPTPNLVLSRDSLKGNSQKEQQPVIKPR